MELELWEDRTQVFNAIESWHWRPHYGCRHHVKYSLFSHFQEGLTSAWPDPGGVCHPLSEREEAIPENTLRLPLFRCRAGHMISVSGGQSPAWHWEGKQSVITAISSLIPTCRTCSKSPAIPAALNARPSREGVAAHFLQTDATVSLFTSHLSGGAGYQLPQMNRIVIQ